MSDKRNNPPEQFPSNLQLQQSAITPAPGQAVCATCAKPLKPGARFCGKCGSRYEPRPTVTPPLPVCRNCGTPLEPDLRFCCNCGTRVLPTTGAFPIQPQLESPPPLEPAYSNQPPPIPSYQSPGPAMSNIPFAPPVARRKTGRIIAIVAVICVSAAILVYTISFLKYRAGWLEKISSGRTLDPSNPLGDLTGNTASSSDMASGKYADFVEMAESMMKSLEQCIIEMESASSASEVASALNAMADTKQSWKSRGKVLDEKYPDFANPDKFPPELKPLADKMKALGGRFGQAMQKASKYADDPEVRAAMKRVQQG